MKTNAWLNYVSAKMIHTNKTTEGKEFQNVSISCPQSKTGIATIAVNLGQVVDSTKKDKTVVAGYKNVLLGSPDKKRSVSICTRKATKNKPADYKTVEMTNAEIAEMVATERSAYRDAHAEVKAEA